MGTTLFITIMRVESRLLAPGRDSTPEKIGYCLGIALILNEGLYFGPAGRCGMALFFWN